MIFWKQFCLEEKPCTPEAPWFCIVSNMYNYIHSVLFLRTVSYTVHKYCMSDTSLFAFAYAYVFPLTMHRLLKPEAQALNLTLFHKKITDL